jgi:hypothetical protein
VYESSPLVAVNGIDNFSNMAEETVDIPSHLTLTKVRVEIKNAELRNLLVDISVVNPSRDIQQIKIDRIALINSNLRNQNALWAAGETSISQMSYEEKKGLFDGNVPDLQGFEYYVGGIFELYSDSVPFTQSTTRASSYVSSFDWRNRHGANNLSSPYYNNGGQGWITSIKDQGSLGSCWMFAGCGVTEALLNLYFNQHINLDLSEQDAISCCPTCWGSPWASLNYIATSGVVRENCFPYTADRATPCSNKLCNTDLTKITSITKYDYSTEDELKRMIIHSGPLSGTICPSGCHAMTLIGFGVVKQGDCIGLNTWNCSTIPAGHSSIGKTYWIFKNQWGVNWGENGFVKILIAHNQITAYAAITPIINPNYSKKCVDIDGDGYYFWGIGTKPAHCPACAPNEPDGDDSNPNLGPMDEYGNCVVLSPTIINSSQTWNTNKTISNNTIILSGVTLTITANVYCTPNAKITIKPGGKLVVNGGKLTNSCPDKVWRGIYVGGNENLPQTAQNQGTLELKNGAIIENARNAIATYELNANGDIDWNTRGGIIKANNATFRNNSRSVEFMKYPPDGTNPVPQNVSYFNNCTFIVDTNYLFGGGNNLRNQFTMWAVTGVKIRGCTFENHTPITGVNPAVRTIDAGYIIDESCTAMSIVSCKCVDPVPSSFKGFLPAIRSTNSEKQFAIKIDHSNFQNNRSGIQLEGINNAQISRINLFINDNPNTAYNGIILDHCTGYKVEENTIYANGSHLSSYGIWIDEPGTDENRIYRNHIYQTGDGIITTGHNINKQLLFPLTGLQYICNDLHDNKYDLSVGQDCMVRSVQGAANKGADNLFSHTPPATFSNFYNSSTNPVITYYYNNSVPRKYPALKYNISLNSNASSNSCVNTLCDYNVAELDEYNMKSVLSSIDSYRKYKQIYSEMMQVFYARGYDKILTDYYNEIIENEELLKEAIKYHENILIITEYLAELSYESLFKLKADSLIDLTQIRDWYDAIYTLNAKYSLAETYFQLGQFEEGLNTLIRIPEMFNLNEYEMIEHNNYVSLFTFKNKIKESGRTVAQLNEAEIEQMIHFAKVSRGLSSVLAQGILCFFYDICFENEEETQKATGNDNPAIFHSSGLPVSESGKSLENISIYPNPTTGELQITNYKLQITNVEVFDIYGQNLYSSSCPPVHSSTINISHLPAGIYFVKITTKEGVTTKKIIKY